MVAYYTQLSGSNPVQSRCVVGGLLFYAESVCGHNNNIFTRIECGWVVVRMYGELAAGGGWWLFGRPTRCQTANGRSDKRVPMSMLNRRTRRQCT